MLLLSIAILVLAAGATIYWLGRSPSPKVQVPVSGADGVAFDAVLTNLCSATSARISLNIPVGMPRLTLPLDPFTKALEAILELYCRRNGNAPFLVAMGKGPVSLEVVFADAAADLRDDERKIFLDWSQTEVAARQGVDLRLKGSYDFFLAMGGKMDVEARLEGGLCLRCRLPLSLGKKA